METEKKLKRGAAVEVSTEELLGRMNRGVEANVEAERGLLSAVLQDPEGLLLEARRKLRPEAFAREDHRLIWEKLLELQDGNQPLDPILLTNLLRQQGLLERVGGPGVVTEVFLFSPSPGNARFYLQLVVDAWTQRKLVRTAAEIVQEATSFGAEGARAQNGVELVALAESKVFGLLEEVQHQGDASQGALPASRGVADWVDHLQRTIDNRGKVLGLRTGIHEIDMTLHGIDDAEGEICVIAGRPAMGKTAMAGTIAHFLAVEEAVPGLIFSIEMSMNQLYTRLVLGPAGVDTAKAITGHFSREDHLAISSMTRRVQGAPLHVCASAAVNTADLRAQVQLAKRRHGIRWIMVDHLHLVKSVDPRVQGDERMRLVEVMETLQFLKKEHKLGVFLLVQMNRDTDKNPGKPPVLADLAGSAAIEQYADHVIFLHREDEYVKWHRLTEDKQDAWRAAIEARRDRSPELWSDGLKYDADSGGWARQDYEEKAMLYVRKNRRGPTPELQVRYQKELTRFSTRMPMLNSTNPLDWQMGTYTAAPSVKRKAREPKAIGRGRMEMDDAFPD